MPPLTEVRQPATFLGHPRGLFYLAVTEGWERFSFYGMLALISLYMVKHALLPGHVEGIAGAAGLRAGLEWVSGPLSAQALASQIFGLYSGLVVLHTHPRRHDCRPRPPGERASTRG